MAWVAAVEAELATLQAGRGKLRGQIERANAAQAKVEEDTEAGAETIIGRIRQGVDWSLSAIVSPGALERAASVAVSEPHVEIARTALIKLDGEISRLEAKLDVLRDRKAHFVAAACREAAEGIYSDYRNAIADLHAAMVQLSGLNVPFGGGIPERVVATCPDFLGLAPSGVDAFPIVAQPGQIAAAVKVWQAFRQALASDPRAPVSLLEFPETDVQAPDAATEYAKRHPLERAIIDASAGRPVTGINPASLIAHK